jgi:hypothetical protein
VPDEAFSVIDEGVKLPLDLVDLIGESRAVQAAVQVVGVVSGSGD